MEYTILGALVGVCFFFIPLWAYRRGLKDGLALAQGKAPEPIKSPVQVYAEHVERKAEVQTAKAQTSSFEEGFANIMGYTGDAQKPKGVES